jgi:hypothetical protein
MDPEVSLKSAIVGCGPSGCIIVNLLKQSSARARLIAVAEGEEELSLCEADQEVVAGPGGIASVDIKGFEVVFFIVDPTEGGSMAYAREIASRASSGGSYTFGLLLLPPTGGKIEGLEFRRSFGGMAIIDSGWVMEKRGGNDPERAIQIMFNFAAHALAFLTGAIDSGGLGVPELKAATAGKVAGFAASHLSDSRSLFALTMSRISRESVKSAIIFLDDAIGDVLARRIFVGIARGLPQDARLSMIRAKGLEPFKILALLAH